MKLRRTPEFDEESRRLALRFCCEDCAHFDPASGACGSGWPNDMHRRARYERPAEPGDDIVFCKEFELG